MIIREALGWIKSNGWVHVIIESDSQLGVLALISDRQDDSSSFGLLVNIWSQISYTRVGFNPVFVKRSMNIATNLLAEAHSSAGLGVWFSQPSPAIASILSS